MIGCPGTNCHALDQSVLFSDFQVASLDVI
jgi:hypothetical protein